MERRACCHCGSLTILCEADPEYVVQCHCRLCQRRTGSAFNLAAWFPSERIQIEGESKSFMRTGDLGFETTFHFCPNCGTNAYWESEPGMIGVAVGCFADADFPSPTVVLYDELRHRWLSSLPVETYARNGEPD